MLSLITWLSARSQRRNSGFALAGGIWVVKGLRVDSRLQGPIWVAQKSGKGLNHRRLPPPVISRACRLCSLCNHAGLFHTPRILRVEERKILVVTNPSGVPFDFRMAHAKVDVNGSPAKEDALMAATGKGVSVRLLPLRSGDVAQRIVVGG
jgi:hypothetical protein